LTFHIDKVASFCFGEKASVNEGGKQQIDDKFSFKVSLVKTNFEMAIFGGTKNKNLQKLVADRDLLKKI
jgi:hypothetical protein